MESKLGSALEERIDTAGPDERFEVEIFLRQKPTKRPKKPRRATAANRARKATQQSLSPFLAFLDEIAHTPYGEGEAEAKPLPCRKLWDHWISSSLAVEVTRDGVLAILERPEVEHVELVTRVKLKDLFHSPAEPLPADDPPAPAVLPIARQVTHVQAPRLWDLGLRGGDVLVAVIDSGINFDHPDLEHRRWDGGPDFPNHGFDFEEMDREPRDALGHGTKCAGLIAGDGSSGLITGIAPAATLMALRVGGVEAHVRSAFQFAIEQGADIISMSMGWSAEKRPSYIGWRRACDVLLDAGVVFVCSAGNDGTVGEEPESVFFVPLNISAPAICPPPWLHPAQKPGGLSAAIACGETNFKDKLEGGSSRGPGAWETAPFIDYPFQNQGQGLLKPDVCGPGRGSRTCNPRFQTTNNLHAPFSGTSAATAVVAGCAALLVQAAKRSNKPVIPQRIQRALEEGAVKIEGQTTKQNNVGSGRVDVFQAYEFGRRKRWWH